MTNENQNIKNAIHRELTRINAIARDVNRPDRHNAITRDEIAIALKDIALKLESAISTL